LAFSWTDKPWFLTEGKFATILIIPSSWGSQLGGYPARIKHNFLAPLPGLEEEEAPTSTTFSHVNYAPALYKPLHLEAQHCLQEQTRA
jgi:hypothetical protein